MSKRFTIELDENFQKWLFKNVKIYNEKNSG